MKSLANWKFILDSFRANIPVMILYVLESKGSSPGRQGFFMAVDAEGKMCGSIGGGIMEHKFAELAKERLKEEATTVQLKKQVHDKSVGKERSGMICSGEQTVLLYPVKQVDINKVENIISSLSQNKNGTLSFDPSGIDFTDAIPRENFHFEKRSDTDWHYSEKSGYHHHLYIIGGGHCSLALSRLMSGLDFYIDVIDERPGLLTMEQNDFAHQKTIVENYRQLGGMVEPGPDHFVVIMTFGYRTDMIALKALINKQFRYLGLMGSRKKTEEMFAELLLEGVSPDRLSHIHSPIGLQIKSETPEEIAVSIAAEIIRIKNAIK